MSGGKNKKQLRRCQVCNRPGHNRSTCPERDVVFTNKDDFTEPKSPTPQHLKFFIHHTTASDNESEHKLNLKSTDNSVWKNVSSAAPKPTKNPDYFFRSSNFLQSQNLERATNSFISPTDILPEQKVGEEISSIDIDVKEKRSFITGNTDISAHSLDYFSKLKNSFVNIFSALKKFSSRKFSAPSTLNVPKKFSRTEPIILEKSSDAENHTQTVKFLELNKIYVLKKIYFVRVAIFVLLILVSVPLKMYVDSLLNFKNFVQSEGTSGFIALKNSLHYITNADWVSAKQENDSARKHFSAALNDLQSHHRAFQIVATGLPIIGSTLTDGQKILLAGQSIALGNGHVLAELETVPADAENSSKFLALAKGTANAADFYKQAAELLQSVNPKNIPDKYRNDFIHYQSLLGSNVSNLNQVKSVAELIPDVLGAEGRRRYLIIFQNPGELRATGGFMGSFAVLEMLNGKIVKLDVPVGGSYDLQGQLSKYVEPPAPLLLANRRWEFQDANWFPDFPASAKKIAWFYRNSRGATVDGVIAINATLLPKILELLGPVEDNKRGVTFDSTNAISDLQNIVERGSEKLQQKPKAVIADLSKILVTRFAELKNPGQLATLAFILQEALTTKDMQLALFDPGLNEIVRELGWDGAIADITPVEDYLMVVNSNIQGQKSDARIEQNISHEAVVNTDGTINVTLTITRHHTGQADEIDYGGTNISYVRVYVPKGSTLVKAEGFGWPDEKAFRAPLGNTVQDTDLKKNEKPVLTDENSGTQVFESFNKFMFSNWMITEPKKTTVAVLTYRLPFKLPLMTEGNKLWDSNPPVSYQLVLQRQSGANSIFESQIIFPKGWHSVWGTGSGTVVADNGLVVKPAPLQTDKVFSVLFRYQ